MLIHYINLRNLRNAGHLQFITEAKGIVSNNNASALQVTAQYNALETARAAEATLFAPDQASYLTDDIQAADLRRDNAYNGLFYHVKSFTYHYDAAKRQAANDLLHAIGVYGEIDRLAYQDESASIEHLINDLTNKPLLAAATATLSLTDWTTELSSANDAFKTLYQQRTAELATRPDVNLYEQRKTSDLAYEALRKRLTAQHEVNEGSAPWSTVVSQLNALIDQYNNTLARRSGNDGGDTPPTPLRP